MSADSNIPGNPEIEEALQKIQENNLATLVSRNTVRETGMAGFLVRYSGGLIRGYKTANFILFLFAIFMLASSFMVFTNSSASKIRDISNIPPEQFVPGQIY